MKWYSNTIIAMFVLTPPVLIFSAGCAATPKAGTAQLPPSDVVADATVLVHGAT